MANKEVTALIRTIRGWEGWRVEETTKGYIAYPPDKTMSGVTIHKTPSNNRWRANINSELRRRGGDI